MLANGAAYYGYFWTLLLHNDFVYPVILDVYVCTYGIIYIWIGARAGRSDDLSCCPVFHPLHPTSKQVNYTWNLQTPLNSDFFIYSGWNSFDVCYWERSSRLFFIWPIAMGSFCFVLSGRCVFGVASDMQLP